MKRLARISAIIALLSNISPAADSTHFSGSFRWPLKLDKQLSSGFGDIRSGRFHLGIDLRTGGREGASVYAPEKGYVWRVKTSYTGYGKGLYVKGESGRIYVFGHLSDYDKRITEYLQKQQLETRRYYQELSPDKGQFPIRPGQLIARTGQTGAGAPHLHFEVRDPDDRSTNPLFYDSVAIRDTLPPKIRAIWLTGLDPTALVEDGRPEKRLVPVAGQGRGRYSISDTAMVAGRFAVEVAVDDPVGAGSFPICPARVSLFLDGRLYHEVNYDRIGFDENKFSLLDRDLDPAKDKYKMVFDLHRRAGNRFSNYRLDFPGDGSFADTVNGYHDLAIEAADFRGNVSRLELVVYYAAATEVLGDLRAAIFTDTTLIVPLADPPRRALFDSLAVSARMIDGKDLFVPITSSLNDDLLIIHGAFQRVMHLRLVFSADGVMYPPYDVSKGNSPAKLNGTSVRVDYESFDADLVLTAVPDDSSRNWLTAEIGTDLGTIRRPYRRIGPNRFALRFRPDSAVEWINRIVTIGPDGVIPDTLVLSLQRLRTDRETSIGGTGYRFLFQPGDLFADAFMRCTDTMLPPPEGGFLVHSPCLLEPAGLSFASSVTVQMTVSRGPDLQKAGLYTYRGKGKWAWAGRVLSADSSQILATVGGTGIVAALADTTAPVISNVNIPDNGRVKISHPQIRCTIYDLLSGIEDDRSLLVTIDGVWMIPEYDPEQRLLTSRTHWPLPGGKHTLRITATDRCGNSTTVVHTFWVRAKTEP